MGTWHTVGRQLNAATTPSREAWAGAARGLWFLALGLLLAVFVGQVILSPSLGSVLAFLILVGMIGAVAALGVLANLLLAPVPWFFAAAGAFAGMAGYVIFSGPWSTWGALTASFLTVAAVALIAGSMTVILRTGKGWARRSVALVTLLAGAGLIAVMVRVYLETAEDLNPALDDFTVEDRTLDLPDPGIPGPFTVARYSYGSGEDAHRSEFGAQADWVSAAVDGSRLLDNWDGPSGWARSWYWGFDAKALPIQGRVWAPVGVPGANDLSPADAGDTEGAPEAPDAAGDKDGTDLADDAGLQAAEGPFPLVLIVHGNHAMEDFSDPGYAYLGEHLASRGFIVVSVDENFLNSSVGDVLDFVDPAGPSSRAGLREENDARGWLLLEHLVQWREWSQDPGHPLYSKVDMDRIALIGHSRGGEAVAIAAHFNALSRYPGDGAVAFDYGFSLKGIIAIAPVDGQYRPRGRGTPLSGVNYLTVHGSMDADVQSFMGQTQFSRTDVSADPDLFKASLYVKDANHGQFNTVWGRTNFGVPFSALLNLEPIMEPEAQRRIARAVFGAFLEAAVNDRREYLPVLADPRRGAAWLPDAYMVSNFQSGRTRMLADFEEDGDLSTGRFDVLISAVHVTRWKEDWPRLKWRALENHAVLLAWDDRVHSDPGQYVLRWTAGGVPRDRADEAQPAVLRFSAARSSVSSLPDGWETDDEDEADGSTARSDGNEETEKTDNPKDKPLDWSVVVRDLDGEEARLPVSTDQALFPAVEAHTRRVQSLSSTATSEIVMRRFALPLADFQDDNPDFDPARISSVRFVFDRSPRGAVLIDDIGLAVGF